jgi:large subunit ribosomal protein L19
MKTENIIKPFLKKEHLDILPGDTVKVLQKIKEGDKERVQIFQGVVIARKHGKEIGATITVRRIISGVGVERIFPLHSPIIEKIEIIKRSKVRRGKLYYLRKAKGKKARLKRRKFVKETREKEKELAKEVVEKTIEKPEESEGTVNEVEKKEEKK